MVLRSLLPRVWLKYIQAYCVLYAYCTSTQDNSARRFALDIEYINYCNLALYYSLQYGPGV